MSISTWVAIVCRNAESLSTLEPLPPVLDIRTALAGKDLGKRGDADANEMLLRELASARPDDAVLSDESAWDAVPALLLVRFPRPLAEPAVRLSPQRALRKSQVGLTDLLVQRGLDLQYPSFRPIEGGLRIAGIHRRSLLMFQ